MARWLAAVATAVGVVCTAIGVGISAFERETATHIGTGSIAAGGAHTVIAMPDGRVFAWGAGTRGQIGDGDLVDRWVPAPIPGMSRVVAVSAGEAHTVAVTDEGEVWAWGANTFGRLGDGTNDHRAQPVQVRGLSNIRAASAGRAHTLALREDGRVFAWGLNKDGQLGTGNRESSLVPVEVVGLTNVVSIAAGDQHSLVVTGDGRVFAWGGNQFGSVGDGTVDDRLRPVMLGIVEVASVAAGDGHSLALTRSGAVWSWGRGTHGQLGTGSTKSAYAPGQINDLRARAIDAGRDFSAAILEDGRVVAWGANGSGQLGDGTTTRRLVPVAVQAVDGAQAIALGTTHAAAVTINGAVRTWGDGGSGRLGAGSTTSSTGIEIMAAIPKWGVPPPPPDSVPPTITATVSPPLHDGWMTAPVTVTFHCADDVVIAACSGPVTIAEDVSALTVEGTAIDGAGNRATTTVIVNVDLHPPVLSIVDPIEGSASDQSVIQLTATLVDRGSGVAGASCNGQPATVSHDALTCTVAVNPGRNDIVVSAIDVIGHAVSKAVTVNGVGTSSSLTLTPAWRALELHERARLSLRDDFGADVGQALWSSSDPGIVELSADDPPVLTAVAVGTATIRAEKDGLNAEATITVSTGLAAGDTRWTLPTSPDYRSELPLFANRVDPSVPDLFAIETRQWGTALVRAVTVDGDIQWQQHVPGVPLMADAFGGLIAGVPAPSGPAFRAYLRLGGGTIRPWRFDSVGELSRPAQAHDGTLYAIEHRFAGVNTNRTQIWDKYVVVIDGTTGMLVSRTLLPREVESFTAALDGLVISTKPLIVCRSYRYEFAPSTLDPIAGADGRGYLVVRRHELHKRADCLESRTRSDRTITTGLDLLVLSPDGSVQTTPLYSSSCASGPSTTVPCDLPLRPFQIMPDGIGGTLVNWERSTHVVGPAVYVQRWLTRISAEAIAERPVGQHFWIEVVGQAGTLIASDGGWKALDAVTGDVKWATFLARLAPMAARPDGGMATYDVVSGDLTMIDAAGNVESTLAVGTHYSVQLADQWIGRRNGQLTAVVGSFADATRFAAVDNKTGQQRVRNPGKGIFAKTHLAKAFIGDLIRYRHVSIRVVPHDQSAWIDRLVMPGVDEFGNRFFTLGAGSGDEDTDLFCGGTLISAPNRARDVSERPWDPLEMLTYPIEFENAKISELLRIDSKYGDNLPYACRPEQNPGFYNSNSFAHGLLNAAGLSKPRRPGRVPALFPGWLVPVPVTKFQ